MWQSPSCKAGDGLAEQPSEKAAGRFLDRRRISGFASPLNFNGIFGPRVRLIEFPRLGIAEYDPVAYRVACR